GGLTLVPLVVPLAFRFVGTPKRAAWAGAASATSATSVRPTPIRPRLLVTTPPLGGSAGSSHADMRRAGPASEPCDPDHSLLGRAHGLDRKELLDEPQVVLRRLRGLDLERFEERGHD